MAYIKIDKALWIEQAKFLGKSEEVAEKAWADLASRWEVVDEEVTE